MASEKRLRVQNLDKHFGTETAVSNVSFDIEKDEIVTLLGPSGCGKTTTLRCIAGVETPDSGTIEIGGDVAFAEGVSQPPEKRGVGMVYQNYAIWPHKTVKENVIFPLKHTDNEFKRSEYEDRVDELLELVEISKLKDEPATDLSGGQQQRTALARALVHDPDLLLLDEPLSNLDRELRTNMRYELEKLQHELGVSVLYVTHDQDEALYLADRMMIMKGGEIVESGTPEDLYSRPVSAFTRGFLGQWNRLQGTIDRSQQGEPQIRTDIATFDISAVDVISETAYPGPLSCFLRPSDIQIKNGSFDTDRMIERQGQVVAEGILGELYEITVQLEENGPEIIVQTGNHYGFRRGDEISILIEPEAIKVYSDAVA